MKRSCKSPEDSGNGTFPTKLLRIMKLSIILLLFGIVQVMAVNSYSQTTKLSLNMNGVSVEQVLDQIEELTEFHFLLNQKLVETERKVDVVYENESVQTILEDMFSGTNVRVLVMDRQILLTTESASPPVVSKRQARQGLVITGTVNDASGATLPGVNILIKGLNKGSISDYEGKFSITVDGPDAVLEFSYVGYLSQELTVGDQRTINIQLQEDIQGLGEVVVVGYGIQKKINLTGAVDIISGDELDSRPSANVGEALQGTSPNLNISLTGAGGEPGAGNYWNIRGIGSLTGNDGPLILVDGVEMNINNLDPESIESVSVLKDAAASAIYGSRAPFGVVLITTKRGKSNKGIRINVSSNFGLSSPINLPKFTDSKSFVTAFNIADDNAGIAHKFPQSQIDRIDAYMAGSYLPEYDTVSPPNSLWRGRHEGNANYEWMGEYYKKNSLRQKHTVSLEGGGDVTQYYISAGLFDQEGAFNWGNDFYRRNNILANINSQPTDWLRFNFSAKYAQTNEDHPIGTSGLGKDQFHHEIMIFWPTTPMYNVDGSISNPFVKSMMESGRETEKVDDFWVTIGTELEPVKGWKTNLSYSYNYFGSRYTKHDKEVWVNIPDGTQGNIGSPISGFSQNMNSDGYSIFNTTTSYDNTVDNHFFKVMLGYEQEVKNYAGLSGSRMELISNGVPSISTALGESAIDDWMGHWATQAVFGRFNYNYKEKYLLEVNARYNGSSRFETGSRWGLFPSVSAGYNISREDFWDPLEDVVNSFKVRASYGSLGNQNVPNYLYLSTIGIDSNYPWLFGGSRPMAAFAPGPVSGSLTWETVTTLDIGLDAAFFSNKLGVTFDWYQRETTDMFGPSVSRPAVLGTWTPLENNAELITEGWETSIVWKDRNSSGFSYNVKLAIGDSKSTVTKYTNDEGTIDNWYEGKEIGEIWGYTTDGYIQEEGEEMPDQSKFYPTWGPGDIKYTDLDGNDTINDGNRTLGSYGDLSRIGNSNPRYNVGISAGFSWKGIDFNMFWQGVMKRDLIVPFRSYYDYAFWGLTTSEYHSTVFEQHLDFWRPADDESMLGPNTEGYYPKPYFSSESEKNHQYQSKYLLNAAYLRLKNIQIGYTLPASISQRVHIQKVRIYFSGENLLTITGLTKILDPETSFVSQTNAGGYGIGKIYPLSRTLSMGINLTF